MNTIKFSHDYPKLKRQTKARLVHIVKTHTSQLDTAFKHYDTLYYATDAEYRPTIEKHFELPICDIIVLYFVGERLFPFTTIRKDNAENLERYVVGEMYDIEIVEQKG